MREGWRGENRNEGKTKIEDLEDDVVADILSRLPLKILLRCRSVCKLWRSLISSYPIVRSRCGQGYSSGFFVFSIFWKMTEEEENGYKMAFISSLDKDMTMTYADAGFTLSGLNRCNAPAKPLSICNGLIFYRCYREPLADDLYRSYRASPKDDFYICNPETKEHVLIPKFTTEGFHYFLDKCSFDRNIYNENRANFATKGFCYFISGLAFDPAVGNNNIASYKLVIGGLKPLLRFMVYSSDTRAWHEPPRSCYPEQRSYRWLYTHSHPPPSVFYHGVLHWLVDVDCILTFDPESETSRWVETPNGGDSAILRQYPIARLVEWEGELYYVRIATTLRLDVWKMSDYSCCCCSGAAANWVLLHSIERFIPLLTKELDLPHWSLLFPVAVDKEGDNRIMFSSKDMCTMILYDLRRECVARRPIDHRFGKLNYAERNGPCYLRYIPTTKFLTN